MDKPLKWIGCYIFMAIITVAFIIYQNNFSIKNAHSPTISNNALLKTFVDNKKSSANMINPDVKDHTVSSIHDPTTLKAADPNQSPTTALWQLSARGALPQTSPLDADIDDYYEISININELSQLQPGQVFELSIPQTGGVVTAIMEDKTQLANGDISLSGRLLDENDQHSVVFTIGEEVSFGVIDTPSGMVLMESMGSSGWLYSADSLDQRIDPKVNDALETEIK